jgi:hypothetical protein
MPGNVVPKTKFQSLVYEAYLQWLKPKHKPR